MKLAGVYILNGDANGYPIADGTVLIGQFTTDGELGGTVNVQVFPEGDNINFITVSLPIGGNCVPVTTNPACSSWSPTSWTVRGSASTTLTGTTSVTRTRCPGAPMPRPATLISTPPTTTDPAYSWTNAGCAGDPHPGWRLRL